MLSKNKIKMERPQTEYFFKTIGGDMEKAVFELNKLINYKGGQGEILIEDIDAVCAKSLERGPDWKQGPPFLFSDTFGIEENASALSPVPKR